MVEDRFKFLNGVSIRYDVIVDNEKGNDADIENVIKTDDVLKTLNDLNNENLFLNKIIKSMNDELKILREQTKQVELDIEAQDEEYDLLNKKYLDLLKDLEKLDKLNGGVGVNISQSDALPVRYTNNKTGEVKYIHMVHFGNSVFVSEQLYNKLKNDFGEDL